MNGQPDRTNEPVKLLLVEDQEDFACLVQDLLAASSGGPFALTHVDQLRAAREKLGDAAYDAVLLDLNLPDSRGLNTCCAVQAVAPATPIVVLTGMDDEHMALQAVALGAQDYVVKGRFEWPLLGRLVRQAIERKRTESALRESGEFFRLISESISDLIVVLDLEGRRLYNSPSYRSLLGDPDLLAGTDSFAEVHPEDRAHIRQLFADTVRTGVGHRADYRLVLPDGSIRHIESRGNVIRDARGQVFRVVVVSRDVTEHRTAMHRLHQALGELNRSHELLKSAQEQLVQAEKLQAVTTFAAGVAHEVMNPLQAISLGIDFLSHFRASDTANADKVLVEMTSAIQRADAVIRGLIDFSAFQKPEAKFEQVNDLVRIALATVDGELREIRIETEFRPAAGLPLVRLEEKTIRHVLINLLMHSMSAMPGGGRLQVATRRLTGPPAPGTPATATFPTPAPDPTSPAFSTAIAWRFEPDQVVVEIDIQDSGAALTGDRHRLPLRVTDPASGLDPTAAAAVTPSSPKPTALSLAVLTRVVELCGGDLQIVSEPGYGNRFHLRFPVGPQPAP